MTTTRRSQSIILPGSDIEIHLEDKLNNKPVAAFLLEKMIYFINCEELPYFLPLIIQIYKQNYSELKQIFFDHSVYTPIHATMGDEAKIDVGNLLLKETNSKPSVKPNVRNLLFFDRPYMIAKKENDVGIQMQPIY